MRMSGSHPPQDPTADATRQGEIGGGNREDLSGRDDDQQKEMGRVNPEANLPAQPRAKPAGQS